MDVYSLHQCIPMNGTFPFCEALVLGNFRISSLFVASVSVYLNLIVEVCKCTEFVNSLDTYFRGEIVFDICTQSKCGIFQV